MQDSKARAGLLSLATYIPRTFQDADYIALQSGVPVDVIRNKKGWVQKNVPGPGDYTVIMGVKAARKALFSSGLDPLDIDLVIWSGEEIKEYRSWPVGPKIQKDLGLKNAWSFDMQQRCGTTVVALKVARDMMRADHRINNVLIATGYQNSDIVDYKNKDTNIMLHLAAGGAACILQRNCPRNEILESHMFSDGSFSGCVMIPAGGSAQPMTKEALAKNLHMLDVMDPALMKDRLDKTSLSNWQMCIDNALKKSGFTRKDVDYLATLLMKISAHKYVLNQMGLKENQSRYLAEFGHHGQNDQILSLELAIEENLVKEGDIVLLISAGIGYAWDAMIMRWGKMQNQN